MNEPSLLRAAKPLRRRRRCALDNELSSSRSAALKKLVQRKQPDQTRSSTRRSRQRSTKVSPVISVRHTDWADAHSCLYFSPAPSRRRQLARSRFSRATADRADSFAETTLLATEVGRDAVRQSRACFPETE